jgi:tetratricopeptide (TPR) repeat protein
MIYQNPNIRYLDWKGIIKIFTFDKENTYQPIRMLSYAIDYKFWKLNPLGYHITNILFYVLTCIMVLHTLKLISGRLREGAEPGSHFRVGLFGAFLFVAHPVHVEAVAWLAARKEVLQGFFFFLAFYLYLKGRKEEDRKRIIFLGLAFISILLATLSKPSAIVFPAVLLVYEISLRQNRWVDFLKRHWFFFTLCIFISLIFVYILMKVMFETGGMKPYRGGNFLNNFIISFYAFLYNIKLLTLTINYSAAYTINVPYPILGFRTLFVIGITFLFFGLSLLSLKKTKVIFFSFLFFLVTLLPYLNVIPISTLLADRYVFIASFSYVFLLGILFDRLYVVKKKKYSEDFFKLLSSVLFLFLLTGYSFMTIQQNKIWENSYTLWSDAVEKHPNSNTANALMGVVYMELGMDEKAVEYLEKAVQLFPIDYESRNNLGIVYGRLKKPEKALKELLTAISLKPENETIQINLSVFYQGQKEYSRSEEILKNLISKNPQNANLYFRLGIVYKEMGKYEAAITTLIKSIELAPHMINPYEELGNIYLNQFKDFEKGKFYYIKGMEMAPGARSKAREMRWIIQDLECHK